jgi:ATP-dependent Clp protease ATP-binding subunit ClpC
MECYSKLFADMKLSYHSDLSKKEIILEGYNLYEFLRGETGVHLFYLAQRNPLPIYLDVSLDGNKEVENYTTIRLYDKDKTITDLRTSYSNSYDIQPDELKILVFGGIDQSNRHRLLAIK